MSHDPAGPPDDRPANLAPPVPTPPEVSGVFRGVVGEAAGASAVIRIGRSAENDLVLDDLIVSRRHAEVRRRADGVHELIDLGSTDGTFVNGRRVKTAVLRERDVVAIGHHLLHLVGTELQEYVDTGQVTFRASGVTVRAESGRVLLHDVSFGLDQQSFLAVVGPSGSGKSTLLNALTGFWPAGAGSVSYDGRDLYDNYEELRLRIGFVPQQDVLHQSLTVRQALGYAAELRFPNDVGPEERSRRVEEVLGQLGLTEAGDRRISLLSGGQSRRVAVAVELLDHPSLLFLDEPTSGLDPGYERSLMHLLRRIADDHHTVVVVTHSVQSLWLCDHVLILAPGGHAAYFGPPQLALAYFGRDDFQQVFQDLNNGRFRDWEAEFARHPDHARFVAATGDDAAAGLPDVPTPRDGRRTLPAVPRPAGRLATFWMLTRRYARVITGDRRNLALLLAQPVLLGLLMLAALPAGELSAPGADEVRVVSRAGLVLLVVTLGATWMGASNAVREIVKELPILRRERAVGLPVSAYIGSKLAVLGLLTAVQCAVLAAIALARQGSHDGGSLLAAPFPELLLVSALTGLAAMSMGLLISALSSTVDRAMTVLPVLLIFQMLLAMGGVFPDVIDKPGLKQASDLAGTQWGFSAAASTVDLGRLQSIDRIAATAPTLRLDSGLPRFAHLEHDLRPNGRWAHERGAWLKDVGALLALTLGAIAAMSVAVSRQRPRA